MRANEAIRRNARANAVPLWKIADFVGVSEPTMTRWLRTTLSKDRENQIMEAIESLKEGEN